MLLAGGMLPTSIRVRVRVSSLLLCQVTGRPQTLHVHDRQAIVNRVLNMLPQKFVSQVRDWNSAEFLAEGAKEKMPMALLFTSKSATTPMYKALSLALKGQLCSISILDIACPKPVHCKSVLYPCLVFE